MICFVLTAFVVMAIQSYKRPISLGLQQDMLHICPDSPNCVCSEAHSQANDQHMISPIKADADTWDKLKRIIVEQGGVIEQDETYYLHATFTSSLFRYVDDVELRFDMNEGLIHLRSASRVGYSGFSVNHKRIERIKGAL